MMNILSRWWKTAAFVFGVLLFFYLANRGSFTSSPPPASPPASSGLDLNYWVLVVVAFILWILPSLTKKVPGGIKWVGILLLGVLVLFGADVPKVFRTVQTGAARLVVGGNEDRTPTVPPAPPPRLLPGMGEGQMTINWNELPTARFTNNGQRRCPRTMLDQVSHPVIKNRLGQGQEPNTHFHWQGRDGHQAITLSDELRNAVTGLDTSRTVVFLVPSPC